MDFTLPESGADVRGLARDIATTISTADRVAELESARAPIDADLWRELGNAGLLGLELSSADAGEGGGELTAVENMLVAIELGRTLGRVPFGPHAIAALPVLATYGSDALRARVLIDAAAGEQVVSVAIEEDLGTDAFSPTTSFSDGALSGVKVNVPYAEAADVLLVSAAGPDGLVVAAISTDAPGVRVTATPGTGLIPTSQVEFDSVAVDSDSILGGDALRALWNRAVLACAAEQTGVIERALELTAEYAREREQFGRAIGSFQAVAQRLADGYIDAQGLALTTTQASWLLANASGSAAVNDPEVHNAIVTAKFWAAEAGHRVAHTTVHVHGGVGLDTSHPVHRYFLRAKHNEFCFGSATASVRALGAELAATPV